MQTLYKLDEVKKMINEGKILLLSGDENLLKSLPKGKWVGGSIPYFMGSNGGVITKDEIYVTILPSYMSIKNIKSYGEDNIKEVYKDCTENGFSYAIIPGFSKVHSTFANNAPKFEGFAARPLVGWISGIHLGDLGKVTPKVFNGETGEMLDSKAIVMHVNLPKNKSAEIGIVNIFEQGKGDEIEFATTAFSATEAIINGKKVNFADYVTEKKVDLKLPLVTDFFGTMINTSFQAVDAGTKTVNFYAPVFAGLKYKVAAPFKNYVEEFTSHMPKQDTIFFTCNCILNFLYAELEGKKTGHITGPITFGEIAYQLLNQTMVYLDIHDV